MKPCTRSLCVILHRSRVHYYPRANTVRGSSLQSHMGIRTCLYACISLTTCLRQTCRATTTKQNTGVIGVYEAFFNMVDLKIIRERTCGTCHRTMQSIVGPYYVLCKEYMMPVPSHQRACDEYISAPVGWGAY